MATFTVDPNDSSFVLDAQGRALPASLVDPADIAPFSSPPRPATTAAGVLAKLDRVPRPGTPALPIASVTATTQQGVAPSVLNPVLDRIGESAEQQATAVERAGEEKAQRGEQQAMARSAAAYGGHVQAEGDAATAHQRAEIARKNELALSLEKDPEIDPDRFINSMSTGQSIATVILAALNGAFKGMTGQSGNDVLSILDQRVDQDIAAQKEQIQSGRVRRGNLIAYFQSQGLREEEAERAARSTSWAMLGRMTDAEVARIGAGNARSEAALVAQQIRGQAAAKREELTLSLGADRSSTTVHREAPKPAGASADDQLKQGQLLQQRLEELDADEVARVISEPDAEGKQRPVSFKRAKAAVDGAVQLAEKLPRVDVAEQQLRNVLTTAGVPSDAYNPDTGTVDWSRVNDLKGIGMLDSSHPYRGAPGVRTETDDVVDAAVPLRESLTYLTTGAVASPTQIEGFKRQAGEEVRSEDAWKKNIEDTARQVATQRKSMLSGNPDATKLYEHNRRQNPAGVGPISSLRPGVN